MKVMVTGHRPSGLRGVSQLVLAQSIRDALHDLANRGADTLLCGMAIGTDMYVAYEATRPPFGWRLHAYVPFPQQPDEWAESQQATYRDLLSAADEVRTFRDHFDKTAYFERNTAMARDCDFGFAVWNGSESGGTWHALKELRRFRKPHAILDPLSGDVVWEEPDDTERDDESLFGDIF